MNKKYISITLGILLLGSLLVLAMQSVSADAVIIGGNRTRPLPQPLPQPLPTRQLNDFVDSDVQAVMQSYGVLDFVKSDLDCTSLKYVCLFNIKIQYENRTQTIRLKTNAGTNDYNSNGVREFIPYSDDRLNADSDAIVQARLNANFKPNREISPPVRVGSPFQVVVQTIENLLARFR